MTDQKHAASLTERATRLADTHTFTMRLAGSFAITPRTPHADDCPGCIAHELLAALAEAERVIRVTAGWNPDRVSVMEAIEPAADYLRTKEADRAD